MQHGSYEKTNFFTLRKFFRAGKLSKGPAVFKRGDPVLLLEHPRKVVLIGEPRLECNFGDALVSAQQRRRLLQPAVNEELAGRQSQLSLE